MLAAIILFVAIATAVIFAMRGGCDHELIPEVTTTTPSETTLPPETTPSTETTIPAESTISTESAVPLENTNSPQPDDPGVVTETEAGENNIGSGDGNDSDEEVTP